MWIGRLEWPGPIKVAIGGLTFDWGVLGFGSNVKCNLRLAHWVSCWHLANIVPFIKICGVRGKIRFLRALEVKRVLVPSRLSQCGGLFCCNGFICCPLWSIEINFCRSMKKKSCNFRTNTTVTVSRYLVSTTIKQDSRIQIL